MSSFRLSRRALALILPLALLWLAALALVRAAPPSPPLEAAPPVDPAYSAALGVNLTASELLSPTLPDALTTLEQAGLRWVRFTLPWDEIEPQRGQFDWPRWDAALQTLARFPALQPVVVLDRAPAWARAPVDADNPLAPPHERADFGRFARAVAERYDGQLRYYQIWHEPNIAPHWGARPADPADYLGLLREAAVNLRAADADAFVITAGLAPTIERGGANLSDIAYLDALYALHGSAWFDAVAGQPYGFASPPEAPADPAALNFARGRLLRDVMLRHGDAETPLFATAYGWNALPDGWQGAASPWDSVSAEAQGRYTADAVSMAQREWPWLGPLFWPAYCPDLAADDPQAGFVLCAPDSPAWIALSTAGQSAAVLPPGRYTPAHPALRYTPGWRVTASAADPSADGDRLEFTFYGTALALRIQGGPYWAYYRIAVDGRPANALPRDETGAAYLVLHDPGAAIRRVTVAENLPVGDHTVALTATGGWGQWALQEIVVGGAPAGLSPAGVLVLAMAALLTVVWTTLVLLGWRRVQAAAWGLARLLDRSARLPSAGLWTVTIALALLCIVSRWAAVDLLSLAGLGLLFLVRPDLSLPLIAAALPFWQQPKHILGLGLSHAEICLWLAVLALAVRLALAFIAGVRRPGDFSRPRSLSMPDLAVLALLVSGLLSTVIASEQGVAWREFRIVFLFGALFYGLITRRPARAGDVQRSPWPLIAGVLAGLVGVSLIGLWQLATGQGRIDVEGVWRVRALYGSPNNLALVLDRGVPLALALAAFLPLAEAGALAARRIVRLLLVLATGVMLLACIATFSKGALLLGLPMGIAVVLLLGARRSGRRWPQVALGAAVLLGIAGLALLFRTPRFGDLLNFETGTSFLRVKLWLGAWHMALAHPLLGVGPDNFLYAYRTRYVLPSAWEELNLSHPHNILLDLWTRLGVVGIVAGVFALIVAFLSTWRLFRRADAWLWPLGLGLLGGLAATLTHGLIDNSLFLPDLMGLFVMALGVCEITQLRKPLTHV